MVPEREVGSRPGAGRLSVLASVACDKLSPVARRIGINALVLWAKLTIEIGPEWETDARQSLSEESTAQRGGERTQVAWAASTRDRRPSFPIIANYSMTSPAISP